MDKIYYDTYRISADKIKNWKNISPNELAQKYLETKEDCYFSAFILKFWGEAFDFFRKQDKKVLSDEECYEFLIDSATYIFDKHVWLNPDSSLYQNPKGPEIAMRNVLYNKKRNFFFNYINRVNCSAIHDFNNLSLEEFTDCSEEDDTKTSPYIISKSAVEDIIYDPYEALYLDSIVRDLYNSKKYLAAMMLDIILHDHDEIFDLNDYLISKNKLISRATLNKIVRTLDDKYYISFESKYRCPKEHLKTTIDRINSISSEGFRVNINTAIDTLAHNDKILKFVNKTDMVMFKEQL